MEGEEALSFCCLQSTHPSMFFGLPVTFNTIAEPRSAEPSFSRDPIHVPLAFHCVVLPSNPCTGMAKQRGLANTAPAWHGCVSDQTDLRAGLAQEHMHTCPAGSTKGRSRDLAAGTCFHLLIEFSGGKKAGANISESLC